MKTTAYQRIRAAMRANERGLLARIRRERVFSPVIMSNQWRNALNRLVTKGRVRYHRPRMGLGGYVALSKHA